MQKGAERRVGFEECLVEQVLMVVAGVDQQQIRLGKVAAVVVGTSGVYDAFSLFFFARKGVQCKSSVNVRRAGRM